LNGVEVIPLEAAFELTPYPS